ncbi:hypothetical protein ASD86_25480 [Lysobacter sp. Root690]|nr:hypothetical protein ASD86_25480 [Lysobacter sp. Root690]
MHAIEHQRTKPNHHGTRTRVQPHPNAPMHCAAPQTLDTLRKVAPRVSGTASKYAAALTY